LKITASSSHDRSTASLCSVRYRTPKQLLLKVNPIDTVQLWRCYAALPQLAPRKRWSLSSSLKKRSQVWINPGFVSYHFDQSKNLNNGNWGAGAEYCFSTVAFAKIGRFYNSNREYSNYAGIYYQPIAIGPIKLGAVVGGFNGYPQTNNGGWFAAALPAFT